MKKKITALCLVVCLAVVAIAGATMAYFTDTKVNTNTFTAGKVEINLDEAKVDEYGIPVEGEDRVTENSYKLVPNHVYTKDPTVTVKGGSEDCYVRVLVTLNKLDELYALPTIDIADCFNVDADKWELAGEIKNDNEKTRTYVLNYKEVVPASKNDTELTPVFTEVTCPNLTNEQIKTLEGLTITVTGNAIQADGFTDADAAWVAFDAK